MPTVYSPVVRQPCTSTCMHSLHVNSKVVFILSTVTQVTVGTEAKRRMISLVYWLQLIGSGFSLENRTERVQKSLSVFTVVKFPNTLCVSTTSGRNGTCYTASECLAKSGSSSGTCASSFGVCCVFEKSCGDSTVAENITYFTSSSRTLGTTCALTICKCSSAVCHLRLDFETFVLNNPVTATTPYTVGPSSVGAGSGNSIGQCQTDTFAVTNPGGEATPIICGTNTGEHMYIPSSDQCNILTANFGSASKATTTAFTIKVTHIECSSKTAAPEGCLQYFTGSSGSINTFNYQSGAGVLLFNQDYSSCIRAERTTCSICYYSTAFKLSVYNGIAAIGALGFDTVCGVPALNSGANGGGYDYVSIPDGQCDYPSSTTPAIATKTADRYCGTAFNCAQVLADPTATPAIAAIAGSPSNTVCTNLRPFKIGVHSDNLEYGNPAPAGEATLANNRGFLIGWFQKTSCQTRPNV